MTHREEERSEVTETETETVEAPEPAPEPDAEPDTAESPEGNESAVAGREADAAGDDSPEERAD